MSIALARRIRSINGMRFVDGKIRQIGFSGPLSDSSLKELLQALKENDEEFAFFDERYPSASDPGAYFSYSPVEATTAKWRMTFGNHGWSGGIYEIDDHAICCQLKDLFANKLIESIKLDGVCFFSHYQLESASRNKAINKELLEIHGGKTSQSPG